MSWNVTVMKVVHVEAVANSNNLDLVIVAGWPCVTTRGRYKVGDLVTYISSDSLVPDQLLAELGLTGKLGGSRKNRVKPVKLRGQVSIGILAPVPEGAKEGDFVAEQLGIIKYEQEVPAHFRGVQKVHPPGWFKYEVDNIRSCSYWLEDGEEVVITEKCHGSNWQACLVNGEFSVSSKNCTLLEDDSNFYWKLARKYDIERKLRELADRHPEWTSIWLVGEGYPCQKGFDYGATEPSVLLFDIRLNNHYIDYDQFIQLSTELDMSTVPLLYRGPYSQEILSQYTDGLEMISGKNVSIREGCVVKPIKERRYGSRHGDRVILKSVSNAYLFRGGETTEFN